MTSYTKLTYKAIGETAEVKNRGQWLNVMPKMDKKMDHTYAMYWNVPSVLHLILQRGKYDCRKFHELIFKLNSVLIYEKIIFNFFPLISTWNTKYFKDLLLSHCYLQVFYFTPAFLIFLYSIFFFVFFVEAG
jgi:hypothetical protein